MLRSEKKDIEFLGDSKVRLVDMGEDLCDAFGTDLLDVQWGHNPQTVKHLRGGLAEIKIDEDSTTHRLVYIAKYEEKIYVLHAFTKKSNQGDRTPLRDKNIIEARQKEASAKHAAWLNEQKLKRQDKSK